MLRKKYPHRFPPRSESDSSDDEVDSRRFKSEKIISYRVPARLLCGGAARPADDDDTENPDPVVQGLLQEHEDR